MVKKIFIINGLGGSGKSTFINDCINNLYKTRNSRCFELSTVDFVKSVARICGWDGDSKEQKDRDFLHDLKMAMEKYDDIPNKKVFYSIDSIDAINTKLWDNYFFVNIREIDSIERFKKMCLDKGFEVKTILFKNPNKESNEVESIRSEIENYNYDIIIVNDGDLNKLKDYSKSFSEKYFEGYSQSLLTEER